MFRPKPPVVVLFTGTDSPPPDRRARSIAPAEEGVAVPIVCRPAQTLAQAVYLSGCCVPPAMCSGLGTCGRCRMRVTSSPAPDPASEDRRRFTPEELARGWRLACKHHPAPGMRVELPEEAGSGDDFPGDERGAPPSALAAARAGGAAAAFLAVDLGTTSLEWRLEAGFAQGWRELWQGRAVNPQMGAGSDVVSRLAFASTDEGREILRRLTQDALRRIVAQSARLGGGCPSAVCLAANTAMTAIALGADATSLTRAPFSVPCAGGDWAELPDLPPVWIPPQPSPFVGGDIAAGYASLALVQDRPPPDYPFLLADLGTNGEFLLALAPDQSLAASVALGPALEGTGLSCGVDARPGAVSDFAFSPSGLEAVRLEEDAAPAAPPGITATGYLALLHILLSSGAMDRRGHFTPGGGVRRFLTPEKAAASGDAPGEDRLPLPLGLRLTARDVEEILKVKAAFSLGLRLLLDKAGIASRDLRRVFIAGALGKHVNKRALENLGFFPPGIESRLEAVGNSALDGAALLMRDPLARRALPRWAAGVRTLDLAAAPAFARGFAEHMRFAW